MTEPSTTGGCLCGGVRFELTRPAEAAGYCHCTRCQKRTGSGSSVQARIDGTTFRLLQGEELVQAWQHPEGGFEKCFCRECGSHLFSRNPDDAGADEHPHGRVRRRPRRAPELAHVRRLRGAVGAGPGRRARALRREPAALAGGCVGSAGVSAGWRSKRGGVTRCGAATSVSSKPAASRTWRSRRRASRSKPCVVRHPGGDRLAPRDRAQAVDPGILEGQAQPRQVVGDPARAAAGLARRPRILAGAALRHAGRAGQRHGERAEPVGSFAKQFEHSTTLHSRSNAGETRLDGCWTPALHSLIRARGRSRRPRGAPRATTRRCRRASARA